MEINGLKIHYWCFIFAFLLTIIWVVLEVQIIYLVVILVIDILVATISVYNEYAEDYSDEN